MWCSNFERYCIKSGEEGMRNSFCGRLERLQDGPDSFDGFGATIGLAGELEREMKRAIAATLLAAAERGIPVEKIENVLPLATGLALYDILAAVDDRDLDAEHVQAFGHAFGQTLVALAGGNLPSLNQSPAVQKEEGKVVMLHVISNDMPVPPTASN